MADDAKNALDSEGLDSAVAQIATLLTTYQLRSRLMRRTAGS